MSFATSLRPWRHSSAVTTTVGRLRWTRLGISTTLPSGGFTSLHREPRLGEDVTALCFQRQRIGSAIAFLLVGFPIFHLGFRVPIAKIASYIGACCAVQLTITPWLFYARRTPQRPDGRVVHRTAAATVFVTTITMLFFYYLRRSRPEDLPTLEFTSTAMGVTVVFAVVFPVISLASRRHKQSPRTRNH